jgi:pyruvate dehydrogenase E1 component beta subunit
LLAAVRSDEPYVFLEPKRLYRRERIEDGDEVAEVDPGKARLAAEGDDALIVAYGPTVDLALRASHELANEGITAAVLDLVSLAPIDRETLFEQAGRCGRVVVISEAIERCSIASYVVALLATELFDQLDTAPRLLASPNRPYPPADEEEEYLPSYEDLLAAVRKVVR